MARSSVGDGDTCPLVPEHGHMVYLRGTSRQYCPHISHTGTPGRGGRPQERAFWPQGYRSFAEAVAEHRRGTLAEAVTHLPDITFTED